MLKPIAVSPLLCLGVMCALAAPLLSYVLQRTGSRIVSETMIFFTHGPTTTGKSTIGRVASSVYGAPNEGIDWAASDRAIAEAAYSCNDLPTLIDDTEKCADQGTELIKRIRLVSQRLPAGETRAISTFAQNKGLPHLRWNTIGITSGPIASSVLAEQESIKLHGQIVRFFDIAVPKKGVWAFVNGDRPHALPAVDDRMAQLNRALAKNYGTLFES